MRQIRKNVFETNSSSTHAICISCKKPEKSKSVYFAHGDFGWNSDVLNTVEERAAYLYEAINSFDCDQADTYMKLLKTILDNHQIKYEFASNSYHYYNDNTSYYISGYIDHGCETAGFLQVVLHDEDMLLRYLFSPDSMVITGNDNDDNCLMNEILYGTENPYEESYEEPELLPEIKANYTIFYKGN